MTERSFDVGAEVFVRDWMGRERAAVVTEPFQGTGLVWVRFDGKTKPVQRASDRIRLQTARRAPLAWPPAPAAPPPPTPMERAVAPKQASPVKGPSTRVDAELKASEAERVEDGPGGNPGARAAEQSAAAAQPSPTVPSERARAVSFLRPVPKPEPPSRDDRYLAFIREHACCACGARENVEAHHFAWKGRKRIGSKPDDFRTVPLCTKCHDHFHDHGFVRGMTPTGSRVHFMMKQVDYLIAWIARLAAPRARRGRS